MTKDVVENIIKRYPYITDAIKRKVNRIAFYVGNRKCTIDITEDVIKVCEIIGIICSCETDKTMKKLMKEIISGKSDVFIMNGMPFSRNAYYARKQAFTEKVYNCCIAWRLVSFEEILNEDIAS